MKGKSGEALKVLEHLHEHPDDVNHSFARAEHQDICQQLELNSEQLGIVAILKQPSYRKRFLIGFFIQLVLI